MWDTQRRRSRRQLFGPHRWQVNAFDWHGPSGSGLVFSASADGTVAAVDLDAGAAVRRLLDLNEGQIWSEEAATAGRWRMVTALSAGGLGSTPGQLIFAGDDSGRCWALDPRIRGAVVGCVPVMKRGGKVTCVHAHTSGAPLLLTSGNDRAMRVWDVRAMKWSPAAAALSPGRCRGTSVASGQLDSAAVPIAHFVHPRTVTSAYWSPVSGGRIVSTCIDNRLRVWDYASLMGYAVGSALQAGNPTQNEPPQRTYVHSHEFARYLSPFRAVWDPKDPAERTVGVVLTLHRQRNMHFYCAFFATGGNWTIHLGSL